MNPFIFKIAKHQTYGNNIYSFNYYKPEDVINSLYKKIYINVKHQDLDLCCMLLELRLVKLKSKYEPQIEIADLSFVCDEEDCSITPRNHLFVQGFFNFDDISDFGNALKHLKEKLHTDVKDIAGMPCSWRNFASGFDKYYTRNILQLAKAELDICYL